jgi:hypothetical protein
VKRGALGKHRIVIFLTPVERARRDDLDDALTEIQANISVNPAVSLRALDMLHYASFAVLEDPGRDPELLFESNIDGSAGDYLRALFDRVKGIDDIYRCCKGYEETPDGVGYLMRREFRVKPRAWHIGNTGRSVAQIMGEARLRRAIDSYVQDNAEELSRSSPRVIRQVVQRFVDTDDQLRWALSKPPLRQTLLEHLWFKGRALLFTVALAAGVLWPIREGLRNRNLAPLLALLGAVGAWAVVQLLHEWLERPAPVTDPRHIQRMAAQEDRVRQNHFASVVAIKRSPLRRLGLEIGLWLVNLFNKALHTKGSLHGIPSIHFAGWSVIDGRRFLFLTNYDGSWGSYLDDFVNRTGWIMTAVWSNCVGFPRTRLLVLEGARDSARLKDWGRGTQVPTRVWYCAYDLTVAQIDGNSALRKGLSGRMGRRAARNWARRL